jgi:hypothetical protein
MISNGIQGEYIARIFEEVKGRPLYVVGTTIGFDHAGAGATVAPVAAAPIAPVTPASEQRRELPKPTKPPPLPRIQ